MSKETNDPREKALDLNRNISVTAGAGSGKTRILVDRFIKVVLEDPSKISRILVITFTEKAAGELQERIALEIGNRLTLASTKTEKSRLLRIRENLNTAYISTIHGFCSRILHEFPFEAHMTPDFRIISDLEKLIFYGQSMEHCLESINSADTGPDNETWERFFTAIPKQKALSYLKVALNRPFEMESIRQRFESYSEVDYINFIEEEWRSLFYQVISPQDIELIYQKCCSIQERLSDPATSANGEEAREIINEFIKSYNNAADSTLTAGRFTALISKFTASGGRSYASYNQLGGKSSWNGANDQVLDLSALCSESAIRLNTLDPGPPPSETDREWFSICKTFLVLYETVRRDYQELKAENGLADFDDLQINTLKLLQNDDLQRELYNRFDFIMVDEFQDTDRLQWQIIRTLASGNGEIDRKKLFIVGDPKQSIYGFRNADIRVFEEVKTVFSHTQGFRHTEAYPGNIIFTDSYRFLPQINGFINYLFQTILRQNDLNPYEVSYHELQSKRDLPGKGIIEMGIFQNPENDTKEESTFIARRIRQMIEVGETCYIRDGAEQERPVQYGDIAILLRSRAHLLEIEEKLRLHKIPFKTIGGIGFWQRQEIFDFYHLLRFINNPADNLALVAVMRSMFFMIPDSALYALSREEGATYYLKLLGSDFQGKQYSAADRTSLKQVKELILKWVALKERITLSELLYTIMEDTSFKAILAAELNGDQLVANVDKLITLAQSFDLSGLGGLNDFLLNIDQLIDQEIQESEALVDLEERHTVKIMTIHAAKGLQFPVVFVPYLNSRRQGNRDAIYINPDLGFGVKINPSGKESGPVPHVLFNLLKLRQYQKDIAEAKRLFYVATSRASNHLVLSAVVEKKIRPDSALEWTVECFKEDGYQLMEEDLIEKEDFILKLNHELEISASHSIEKSSFFDEMVKLNKRVERWKTEDLSGVYTAPQIESSIAGRTFSATMIMTYLENPREFHERYNLGYFEGDYQTFVSELKENDQALLLGKIVHRYLERWGNSSQDFDERSARLFFEFDVFDPQMRKTIRSELQMIQNKISESAFARRVLTARKAKNETAITMRIADDYLTGTIDRMIQNDQGLWEVIDYKTNRISGNRLPEIVKTYQWQLKTYALLLSRLFPEQEKYKISLFFVKSDLVHPVEFSKAETQNIMKELLAIIDEIKTKVPVNPAF